MLVFSTLLLIGLLQPTHDATPSSSKNPRAVAEVVAGERTEANAAWWGFDRDDATEAIQSAINSGAKRVIIPKMAHDWVVRPLQLVGNQELIFKEGVVIAAKRGEFRGGSDTVFSAKDVENLTIRGRGATIRMNKEDYIVGLVLKELNWRRWFGQYTKAEWRSVFALRGCKNVEISGLTLRDSGGDGIYIDHSGGDRPCQDIRIKDVVCENNYRQGMSIIGVEGLVVDSSSFNNTWGTPPSAGVDIEPDSPTHTLKGIVFRNCKFDDNYGDGIELFLGHLSEKSEDISIRFENCRITSRLGSGIRVTRAHDDGPKGLIEFLDCVVENTQAYGIKVQDKGVDRARVRFVGCRLRNVAQDRNYQGAWVPIWLQSLEPERVKRLGGFDFIDCTVEDNRDRPVLELTETKPGSGLYDVTGAIRATSPFKAIAKLGDVLHDVTLTVKQSASASE